MYSCVHMSGFAVLSERQTVCEQLMECSEINRPQISFTHAKWPRETSIGLQGLGPLLFHQLDLWDSQFLEGILLAWTCFFFCSFFLRLLYSSFSSNHRGSHNPSLWLEHYWVCDRHSHVKDMNVRIIWVRAMEWKRAQTKPRIYSHPYEDLLTSMKTRKLKSYGHVTWSSGLAKTILQG